VNIPTPKELLEQLRGRVTDPARLAIAEELVVDLTQLQARALAGEQVQGELLQVQAQVASLTATEAGILRDVVMTWVGQVAAAVVRGAFAAAG